MTRSTIFISHANPKDNDVAAWLASKLTALGYSVWVDIKKLKGGETFWPEIEQVIRNEICCFVLILSRESNSRPGVLKELRMAQVIEKEIPGLVIPWKVDDLPFDDINIDLQGKICVSHTRWSDGLRSLMECLEGLNVPRNVSPYQSPIIEELLVPEDVGIVYEPAFYDLNRVACLKEPDWIYVVDPTLVHDRFQNLTQSTYAGLRMSLFPYMANSNLFERGLPRQIRLPDFLINGEEDLGIDKRTARNIYTELVRKLIHSHFLSAGLREYSMARNNPVYFFNQANCAKGEINVKIPGVGKASSRAVWGIHKDKFWHLGFEFSIGQGDGLSITLNPHIIFTLDKIEQPLDEDSERNKSLQHRARRKVARSWWNDKWRGFYYPFLAFLKNSPDGIKIELHEDCLLLSDDLLRVSVPVTHDSVGLLEREEWEVEEE